MDMAWTDARDFAAACARIARDDMLAAAVAARAAQADGKDWAMWVKEIER
jgi:hypothetical protein